MIFFERQEEFFEPRFLSFCDYFDRTVGKILHRTSEVEVNRCVIHKVTIVNSLYAAMYDAFETLLHMRAAGLEPATLSV